MFLRDESMADSDLKLLESGFIDKKLFCTIHKKTNIDHSIQVKISLLIQEKNNCNFLCAIFYTY